MLIEGMKTLKVLEKRIATNTRRINEYAAIVSTERPVFATQKEQEAEIKTLIQANGDLVTEYLDLKRRVDMTNLQTRVQIGKDGYTIADLLQLRRGLAKMMRQTYQALNDDVAEARLRAMTSRYAPSASGEKPPHIERLYDEKAKNEGLRHWQDLEDEIETRLEVINATTPLVD